MAFAGNTFIFIAIFKNRALRTRSNCFLASLAMTDFLVGAVLGPIFITQVFSDKMAENCALNDVRRSITALLTGSSMGTIAAISYDRYVHLKKTLQYNQNMTILKVCILLSMCWILPLISTFLNYVGHLASAYSASIFTYALINIAITIVCYVKILKIIREKNQEMTKIAKDEALQRNASEREERRALRTEKKVAIAILTVTLVYVASVLPISVYLGLTAVRVISTTSKNVYIKVFYSIALTISAANSTVNPFIYYYRVPGFKETIKKTVKPSVASFTLESKKKSS